MAETDSEMTDLDDLFGAARRQVTPLPADLEARIVADGLALQRSRQAAEVVAPVGRPLSGLGRLLDLLGGWPALGGLATACAAGIWLGVAPPQILPDPLGLLQSAEAGLFADDDLVLALAEE